MIIPDKPVKKPSHLIRHIQIGAATLLALYFGRALFIPLFFGLLVAFVVYPACRWLEQRHFRRSIAITICLGSVILLFFALLGLLGWQLNLLGKDLPGLSGKLGPFLSGFGSWLSKYFSLTPGTLQKWLQDAEAGLTGNTGTWLQHLLSTTANTVFSLFIIPIHSALFLYHRGTFVRFLHKVIGPRLQLRTSVILQEAIDTYSRYIKGMVLVYLIVGILNSIGLMALGIEHAILFGMLTAIMTMIPYVGIIVSASLPVSIALMTKESLWYPAGVVLVFSFVQYLEANVIFPKVVGAQLNVSTWATLVAIIIGGILWNISGMILFIPFVAILKIVSDHVPELEAVNILLKREEHRTQQ